MTTISEKIKLTKVRIAYAHGLNQAYKDPKQPDKAGKFGAKFILDKNDPQVKEIKSVMARLAKTKWADKAEQVYKAMQAQDKLCLHDGDTKADEEGFEGNFFISASSKNKIPLFDRVKDRDTGKPKVIQFEDGKVRSGDYVNISLNLVVQDNEYGKRINAYLNGVQFCEEGEPLCGGAMSDGSEFDATEADDSDDPF